MMVTVVMMRDDYDDKDGPNVGNECDDDDDKDEDEDDEVSLRQVSCMISSYLAAFLVLRTSPFPPPLLFLLIRPVPPLFSSPSLAPHDFFKRPCQECVPLRPAVFDATHSWLIYNV